MAGQQGKEQGERWSLERLRQEASRLPGLEGYKAREVRREVDRRVRDEIRLALERVQAALTDVQHELLRGGGVRWMDDVERVQHRITLLSDKVRSAAYGYRPLFDLEQIRESELERLIHFDRQVLSRVLELHEQVAAVRAAAGRSAEALGNALQRLHDTVQQLVTVYTYRERVAHGEPVPWPETQQDTSEDAARGQEDVDAG